ncbi:MAG: VTT domain-containing protein [Clostridia bacterium]|nr:VTT domain-containing protein [Clostridia bacterium]
MLFKKKEGCKSVEAKGSKLEKFMKIAPVIITGCLIVFYFIYLSDITVEDIINYVPPNYFLAFVLLMFLYAAKSLSIVFPRIILYISAGIIFSPPLAIMVNVLGAAVCLSVPYFVGRYSGKKAVLKLTAKYPKMEKVAEMGNDNGLFTAYILRAVGCLPGDLVSMFLGASSMNYWVFLIGSLLGWLPGLVFQTLLGACINQKPTGAMIALFIIMALIALLISVYCNKKARSNEAKTALIQK